MQSSVGEGTAGRIERIAVLFGRQGDPHQRPAEHQAGDQERRDCRSQEHQDPQPAGDHQPDVRAGDPPQPRGGGGGRRGGGGRSGGGGGYGGKRRY